MSTKSDVEKYGKMTQREHILLRPDTYVGDVEPTTEKTWIFNTETKLMEKKLINFTPGFFKIFDEVILNSRDHAVNDSTCDLIKIIYDKEENYISVFNNGDNGIPVDEHPVHKVLIPTMIFGELLTSSNYDDTEQRVTGGRNGYGAKLANIFSTKFIVEVADAKRKKYFKQVWLNNMEVAETPQVSTLEKGVKSYVKVTFYPDLKRFNMESLDNDHYNLFYRRAVDIAGVSEEKIKVFFNGEKVEIKNFKEYVDLYYPGEDVIFDNTCKNWYIGCMFKPESNFEVISFVNSISTYRGGSHVDYVTDLVTKKLISDVIKKKGKDVKVTPTNVKENLIFFVNSTIINPAFSSQTKDTLTTKADKFGSKYEPSEAFLKKLSKSGVVEHLIDYAKFKEDSFLKKNDGKKQVKIRGIPKLEDANKAGTKDSYKCSLILTEGDSAKTFAMAGLNVVGRDYFGIFPLKGKLLNVREASKSILLGNEEISHLKQILGLKHKEDYTSEEKFKTLRYGRVIILTDQDVDGSHIKGLIMNMFHYMWPSLLVRPNFIASLSTPIVKAFKGKEVLVFYNLTEYDVWKESSSSKGWTTKYYKGLGTSKSEEAQEYFEDIEEKLIHYFWDSALQDLKASEGTVEKDDEKSSDDEDECDSEVSMVYLEDKVKSDNDAILLAFDKEKSNERKYWLMKYNKDEILTYEQKKIQYYDFIHRDLKHFSNYDNQRSIPSVIDGLKPSQRKILYGAFERGLQKEEVKVVQLAGFVSDKAAYHHGEASLMGAIIGMAQDFVGSNNINLLKPNGQFGARLKGGKDAASPRYIYTMLEELTTKIFKKEDEPVLTHQYDDGVLIEPEYYIPIIPMVLINGTDGIGTGFSTKLPCYNPLDVIHCIRQKIMKKESLDIHPWWFGYRGKVEKISDTKYDTHGVYNLTNNILTISELPVGTWTSTYKEFLEKMLEDEQDKKQKTKKPKEKTLIGYTDNNTDSKVHFELELNPTFIEKNKDFAKQLKLSKTYNVSNIHLYNSEGRINKYESVKKVIDDFYDVRYAAYVQRKKHQLEILRNQLELLSHKVRFILMVIDKEIIIEKKKRAEIESLLEKLQFPKLPSYDYLLGMPLYNLTIEKVEELKKLHNEKEMEHNTLQEKREEDIWLDELEELEIAYHKWIKEREDKLDSLSQVSKKKKNIVNKKGKKTN